MCWRKDSIDLGKVGGRWASEFCSKDGIGGCGGRSITKGNCVYGDSNILQRTGFPGGGRSWQKKKNMRRCPDMDWEMKKYTTKNYE